MGYMVRSEEQKKGTSMDTFYEEDILGEGFQRATISLCDDYEGRAIATLGPPFVGFGKWTGGALYSWF